MNQSTLPTTSDIELFVRTALLSVLFKLIEGHHLVKHDGRAKAPQEGAIELKANRLNSCGTGLYLLFVPLVHLREQTTAL